MKNQTWILIQWLASYENDIFEGGWVRIDEGIIRQNSRMGFIDHLTKPFPRYTDIGTSELIITDIRGDERVWYMARQANEDLRAIKSVAVLQRDRDEALVDITSSSTYNKFFDQVENSRDIVNYYTEWADEFCQKNLETNWAEVEYLSAINSFTREKIYEFVTIKTAKRLWVKLGDIPVTDDGDIEEPFYTSRGTTFLTGTNREDIWDWFEEEFDVSVHDLMYKKL